MLLRRPGTITTDWPFRNMGAKQVVCSEYDATDDTIIDPEILASRSTGTTVVLYLVAYTGNEIHLTIHPLVFGDAIFWARIISRYHHKVQRFPMRFYR